MSPNLLISSEVTTILVAVSSRRSSIALEADLDLFYLLNFGCGFGGSFFSASFARAEPRCKQTPGIKNTTGKGQHGNGNSRQNGSLRGQGGISLAKSVTAVHSAAKANLSDAVFREIMT